MCADLSDRHLSLLLNRCCHDDVIGVLAQPRLRYGSTEQFVIVVIQCTFVDYVMMQVSCSKFSDDAILVFAKGKPHIALHVL